MPVATGSHALLNAGLVLIAGTVLFFLLLARAELLDVWVEIARNTRPQPSNIRYPGIGFLSFVFRLSGYLLLAGSLLAATSILLGVIQTPALDLQGLLWSDRKEPSSAATRPDAPPSPGAIESAVVEAGK